MGLSNILVYFLLFQMAWSELTTIPQGFGYVEDEAVTRKKCGVLEIELDMPEDHYFAQLMKSDCVAADRIERPKRMVQVVVAPVVILGVVVIGVGLVALTAATVVYAIYNELRHSENEESFKQLNKTLHRFRESGVFTHEELERLKTGISNSDWDRVRAQFFKKSALESIFKFLGYDPIEIMKQMGFDTRLGTDVLSTFESTFYCGKSGTHYQLRVCGHESPTRKYGEVQLVAPIGNFVYSGQAYRYFDVPRYAVKTKTGDLVSAESCQKIGSHFKCQLTKSACTVANYKKCKLVMKPVRNEVVTFELGDSTLIATTKKEYKIVSDGDKKGKLYDVPESGHFIFQAPHDTYVQLFTKPVQKFYGRHDQLVLRPVSIFEAITTLQTHQEIDEWNEHLRSIDEALTDYELSLIHRSHLFSWTGLWDKLVYLVSWFWWFSPAVVLVVALIAFVFSTICCSCSRSIFKAIIKLFFFLACCCCCCCCRGTKGEEANELEKKPKKKSNDKRTHDVEQQEREVTALMELFPKK